MLYLILVTAASQLVMLVPGARNEASSGEVWRMPEVIIQNLPYLLQ